MWDHTTWDTHLFYPSCMRMQKQRQTSLWHILAPFATFAAIFVFDRVSMSYLSVVLFSSSLFHLCDSANFVFLHSALGRPENLQILSPVARGLSARGHSVSSVRYDGLIMWSREGQCHHHTETRFRECIFLIFRWLLVSMTEGWVNITKRIRWTSNFLKL